MDDEDATRTGEWKRVELAEAQGRSAHVSVGEAGIAWRPDLPPTGLVLARANGAKGGVPPVVCGEAVLYYDGTWLRRLDLASGEAKGWMKIETWGKLTSPVVVFDSLAVFATDERGLVCARRSRR